jgi:cytidyltransferase-like protein
MIALFSGRFDRPHPGHIIQLKRLGEEFDRVIVPVLDYPEQKYPVQYRVQILEDAMNDKTKYSIFANKDHFGRISMNEIENYFFDIYVSGNVKCLKHIESLGFKVRYVDRAYDYSASEEG